jgi:hypothetical protein
LSYCRGVDRRDLDLVRACYHADARDDHGTFIGGLDDYIAFLDARLAQWDATTHLMTNILIELQGDHAGVESYCLAFHRRGAGPGSRELVIAMRYVDRFERRADEWRIADRRCVVDWSTEGEAPPQWSGMAPYLRGRHGRDDEVFVRSAARASTIEVSKTALKKEGTTG